MKPLMPGLFARFGGASLTSHGASVQVFWVCGLMSATASLGKEQCVDDSEIHHTLCSAQECPVYAGVSLHQDTVVR